MFPGDRLDYFRCQPVVGTDVFIWKFKCWEIDFE